MRPRTRAVKSTKILKENIGIVGKTKVQGTGKVTKPPRKVLGDKTNSASDDNASLEIPKLVANKSSKKVTVTKLACENDNMERPRRDKRIPSRFADSQALKFIVNSKENSPIATGVKGDAITKKTDVIVPVAKVTNNEAQNSMKDDCTTSSPFKTPQKVTDVSLVAMNRPRRISRLPSRFEDHSISPSKFIPVQPCHASTPLVQKNATTTILHNKTADKKTNKSNRKEETSSKLVQSTLTPTSKVTTKKTAEGASDANNNAKGRTLRTRKVANVKKSPLKNVENNAEKVKNPVKQVVLKSKLSPEKVKSPVKQGVLKSKLSPEKVKSPVKQGVLKSKRRPLKLPSPVKQSQLKKVSLGKDKTPVKKGGSKAKQSPVKQPSPVKYSYLSNVDKEVSFNVVKSPVKLPSPVKKTALRSAKRDLSFKLLEDNNKNNNKQDIYEFTFDPNEEPAPQKKKRKPAKKRPAKPKTVVFKNNYDKNVNKALAALKTVVTKNPDIPKPTESLKDGLDEKQLQAPSHGIKETASDARPIPQVQRNVASKIIIGNSVSKTTNSIPTNHSNIPQIQEDVLLNVNDAHYMHQNVPADSNKSIRVEDIEADFETSPQHHVNYSPVNSPCRPETPVAQIGRISNIHNHDDPLNLKENISFDPNPVASSSMNTSVRQHHASPWRVDFDNLPIRWHVSSYVKPNMTPAVECSFVNFDDKNKKKHVYTNLVPESNEPLPEIVQNDQPNLIQTSIISFIKEVLEKSSSKKNRGRSATPVSASMFEDLPDKDKEKVSKTTRQLFTPKKNPDKTTSDSNSNSSKDDSNDKENSKDSSQGHKRKNNEEANPGPTKTPRKEKDDRYFGFDDSENLDQENVSPKKDVGRKKSVRQRARAVLKEMNAQSGPTRADIPLAAKTARKQGERLYDEMISASDAPVSKENVIVGAANTVEPVQEVNEDSQTSLHLFEDIEFCHRLKQNRKSYGKAKKVNFIRQASSDSDTQDSDPRPEKNSSDAEEDLNDLTFDPGMPLIEDMKKTKKKQTKKQKMTKKEEEEAEKWAASFNSMCEDVDDFPLVVE